MNVRLYRFLGAEYVIDFGAQDNHDCHTLPNPNGWCVQLRHVPDISLKSLSLGASGFAHVIGKQYDLDWMLRLVLMLAVAVIPAGPAAISFASTPPVVRHCATFIAGRANSSAYPHFHLPAVSQ